MTLQEVLQFRMPRGYKITQNFDTLSKTINVLGSELGNVIKDQAGAKYFKIVEDIRLNSKKYRIMIC